MDGENAVDTSPMDSDLAPLAGASNSQPAKRITASRKVASGALGAYCRYRSQAGASSRPAVVSSVPSAAASSAAERGRGRQGRIRNAEFRRPGGLNRHAPVRAIATGTSSVSGAIPSRVHGATRTQVGAMPAPTENRNARPASHWK